MREGTRRSPIGFSGSEAGQSKRPGSGNFKEEGSEMRDCYYERDTGIGDFEVRDSGNNHLNDLRTGMSLDENEKHQAKRRRSGYCAGMKIISEAKLPIYQKSSMAHRATRHVRLLRQLKCLTASKNLQQVSELYIYDALNLLSCMTLDVKNIQFIFLHHKGKLFMVLDYPTLKRIFNVVCHRHLT